MNMHKSDVMVEWPFSLLALKKNLLHSTQIDSGPLCHYPPRYNNDLELEDAIHTAILTLKVVFFNVFFTVLKHYIWSKCICISLHLHSFVFQESFEGQMTEENIEVGICNEAGFKRLTPAEVKDYLAAIAWTHPAY